MKIRVCKTSFIVKLIEEGRRAKRVGVKGKWFKFDM